MSQTVFEVDVETTRPIGWEAISVEEPGQADRPPRPRNAEDTLTDGGLVEEAVPGWVPFEWDPAVLELDDIEGDADRLVQDLATRATGDERAVVDSLFAVAEGRYIRLSVDARSLALEILAMAARLPRADRLARRAAAEFLSSAEDSDLRFAAVAAASDLSKRSRQILRPLIELRSTSDEPDASVRAAASAFLAVDARRKSA